MTKIDKLFFIWLQEMANRNNEFNALIYEKIKKIKNLYDISKDINKLCEYTKNMHLTQSIIEVLNDNNIKEKAIKTCKFFKSKKVNIITYEDECYPYKLRNNSNSPFIIISNNYIDFNLKNIYVFFDNYFTKFAKNLTHYFVKIINDEKYNVFSEYSNRGVNTISIIYKNLSSYDFNSNNCYIILPNIRYINEFFTSIIDVAIIIEARYESKIVKCINMLLDKNKDIYVVPSNIFRKNSYFSNYLIKEGADIILNKKDLKFILNNIIY